MRRRILAELLNNGMKRKSATSRGLRSLVGQRPIRADQHEEIFSVFESVTFPARLRAQNSDVVDFPFYAQKHFSVTFPARLRAQNSDVVGRCHLSSSPTGAEI